MNDRPDNGQFDDLDSAIQALLTETVPRDAIERVKTEANRLGASGIATRRTPTQRPIWFSPWPHLGGVAVAALIVAITLFSLFVHSSARRVFAEVVKNVRQAGSVQMTMIAQIGRQSETKSTVYFVEDRWRVEQSYGDAGELVHIGDMRAQRALVLDTHRNRAQSINIDEEFVKSFSDPIDQLRRASSADGENIGEELLKGRLTVVYRMTQVDLLGFRGNGEMMLWVDASSKLPVKIVIRDRSGKSETTVRFEDFVWNQPLSDDLFAFDVPPGFQMATILPVPRSAESSKHSDPLPVSDTQRAQGILSRDRVPGRIVWGPSGKTLTALMRDPEAVAARSRRSTEIRQWDVASGELNWSIAGGSPFSLAAASDGTTLATADRFGLQLRDASNGKVEHEWDTDEPLSCLAFSPDGQTVAAGIAEWGKQPGGREQSGGVQFWDVQHRSLRMTLPDDKPTTFVRFSKDGKYLASAPNGGPVKIWDATRGDLVRIFPYGGKCDISPDNRLIACMASRPLQGDTQDDVRKSYDVQIYELQTGKLTSTLVSSNHTDKSYVLWIEFSPQGDVIVVANWDGTVKVWSVATGHLITSITRHDAGVHTAVFNDDGDTLATGSEDQTLRVWDVAEITAP